MGMRILENTARWGVWGLESVAISVGVAQLIGLIGGVVSVSRALYSQVQLVRCRRIIHRINLNQTLGVANREGVDKINKALRKIHITGDDDQTPSIMKASVRMRHYRLQRDQSLRASTSYGLLTLPVVGLTLFKENQQGWKFKAPEPIADLASLSAFAVSQLKLSAIFPGYSSRSIYSNALKQQPPFCNYKEKIIPIPVADGTRRLMGRFYKSKNCFNQKTIILFHPNADNLNGMAPYFDYYKKKGLNVLAVTMGGYQGSDTVPVSEATVYEDAIGSIDWIKKELGAVNGDILCHGTSLGAALAVSAGYFRPGVAVIADQGFTTVDDAAYHFVATLVTKKTFCPLGALAGAIAKGVMKTQLSLSYTKASGFKLDGLDNKRKLKEMRKNKASGALLAISTTQDRLMNKFRLFPCWQSPGNLADDLVKARYRENLLSNHHTYDAEHVEKVFFDAEGFSQDFDPVEQFLREHEFIHEKTKKVQKRYTEKDSNL